MSYPALVALLCLPAVALALRLSGRRALVAILSRFVD